MADDCVEWQGARMARGYGRLRVNGRQMLAHRVAWERANGPIPEGYVICHRCDNPPCVNVDHLFLGTQRDNVYDMCAKGRHVGNRYGERETCCHGHDYTPENTYIHPDGSRVCRTCSRAHYAKYDAKRRKATA
jgi:hypothetical protein